MAHLASGGALSTCTYGEVSPIFLHQNIAKVIFLGPNKTKTIFMIFFDSKRLLTNISGLARGKPDFYLHCFRIFYVHVQASRYKMS